jgi:hypothetical protein
MDLAEPTPPTNIRAPPISQSAGYWLVMVLHGAVTERAKGTLPGTLPLTALDKYDLFDNIRCVPNGSILR